MPALATTVYLDECVDHRVVPYLRQHQFTVLTAADAGLLGADDEPQLAFAASNGLLLVSHNRRHFSRLHARYTAEGRSHAGVALLPPGPIARLTLRIAMMLAWIAAFPDSSSRLFLWNDLQRLLIAGERLGGFTDQDLRVALGQER